VLPEGATVDQLPLVAMVGPCLVVQTDAWPAVSASDLESLGIPRACSRLLIRTRASRQRQHEASNSGSAGLTIGAADWLVARGVALVGIDCPSIESEVEATQGKADSLPVHRRLLAAGIVVVEGLQLKHAGPGAYLLVCLPLKLEGLDGAPVRAILLSGAPGAPGMTSPAPECHS
jgi:arylformamidase